MNKLIQLIKTMQKTKPKPKQSNHTELALLKKPLFPSLHMVLVSDFFMGIKGLGSIKTNFKFEFRITGRAWIHLTNWLWFYSLPKNLFRRKVILENQNRRG
jgi:hypothetical protein